MSNTYNRKDKFYFDAKKSGLRSRAYFKLQELDEKYKLIKRNNRVFDLGAWPGGWLQYVSKKVGPKGLGIGIDLQKIDELNDNIKLILGDVRDDELIELAIQFADGKFDCVISDMSPSLTGIKVADMAGSVGLAELAVETCHDVLKIGGDFTCKVFKSAEADIFFKSINKVFEKVIRAELKSTRKTSREFYIVGKGYQGRND